MLKLLRYTYSGLLSLKPFVFFILSGSPFLCVLSAQEIEVRIDSETEFQKIDGFGASDAWRAQFVGKNWPAEKRDAIAELLFSQELDPDGNPKGIGLSLWRFYIGGGSMEQGEASDIENIWRRGESFIDEKGNYDWSKQAGQQWFLKKAHEHGVDRFLAFSIAPPTFWSLNGKGYAATEDGKLNLQEDKFDDYTDFMVKVLDHFKSEDMPFDYLSPINEQQWDWEKASQEGTPATNANVARLVRELNEKLTDKNLDAKIVTPESADLRFLYGKGNHDKPKRDHQIEAFFTDSDTQINNLAHVENTVSGHSYFTTWPVDSLITIRQKLDEKLKKVGVGYWQSEFCILENTDDIGGGRPRDLGMPTALYVARVIHADLTLADAKAWQWWTAITRADFKDGLIYIDTGNENDLYAEEPLRKDGDYHDSKLLWALGNFSRFVRPGFVRVEADLDDGKSLKERYENVMVSAYRNPASDELVMVAINYSHKTTDLNWDNTDAKFDTQYVTSKDKNLESSPVSNTMITLAARSITTLVGRTSK